MRVFSASDSESSISECQVSFLQEGLSILAFLYGSQLKFLSGQT